MRSAVRLPLLLALAAGSCQRATPATEPTTAPTDAPTRPELDDRKPPTPAADPTHPLELVPARANAMIMVRSAQRLAWIWGRERFVGRFPAEYEELVGDMKREIGHDLLDPAGLAAIGVDPTAPLGVAVLSFQDEAFVVFGGVSNPTAMLEVLRKLTGKPLVPEAVGEAQVVRMEQVSLVLRHGMFALVWVDRHRDGGTDYAREVARIDPAQSLAHATSMERAHAGLPHEADVQGLLDVAGIIREVMERSRRQEQEMVGEVSRRLAEARQRGAGAEEITSLQQQVQSQQEFAARLQRERQVTEILLSRTLGAIEGIGLVVNADETRGLLGRIHLALTPDAMFRELLVASERPPAAIVALGDAPQLVLSSQVDVGVAIDLFAQAAMAAGSSYAEVNEDVLRDLRVDFDRAVRPLLDGRGTFVLTSAPELDPKRVKDIDDVLGGLLALGVSDETKAKALLAEVVAKHGEQRFTPVPEISGFTLVRSTSPRAFHLGVVNGQLVVGTDMAAIRRLRDGQVGPASSRFADPEPWQRLTEGEAVGRLAMHHRLPIATMFAFMGSFDSFDFPRNPDDQLANEFPGEDVFSVPRSAATGRTEKERNAAYEAKDRLQERKRKQRQVVAWNLAEALGITAGVVRELDSGLVIEGGHYVAGGGFGYAEAIVKLVQATKGGDDPELVRARKKMEQLEERLLKARRKDIQRAIAKRGSKAPPPPPAAG